VLAVTGVMSREVVRQAKFAQWQFASAFRTDLLASILQVAMLVALWKLDRLSPGWLFLSLGLSSWLASADWWLTNQLGRSTDWTDAKDRWSKTWRFGRWEAMGQTCQVVQIFALPWILVFTGGFAAAGLYAAAW